MISQLQLKSRTFSEISLLAADGTFDETHQAPQIVPKVTLGQHKEDPRKWKVELSLEIQSNAESPPPYSGKIVVEGYFEVSEQCEKELIEPIVAVNGSSLLYGSVREIVFSFTAQSTHGAMMLPTLDFRGLLNPLGGVSPEKKEKSRKK